MLTLLTGWALGVLLGMRHALEPDHLAAVSTLVADRRSPRAAAFLGACWGLGHTLALLGVGCVLLCLRVEMPARLADSFELGVALMLLVLGGRALVRARMAASDGPRHLHEHGVLRHVHHVHRGAAPHVHLGRLTLARRPLAVGLVHGLAGSGALTALVLANMPTLSSALVYMALFGVGSLAGMALLTGLAGGLVGLSLRRTTSTERVQTWLVAAAGAVSVALGLGWGYPLVVRLLGA